MPIVSLATALLVVAPAQAVPPAVPAPPPDASRRLAADRIAPPAPDSAAAAVEAGLAWLVAIQAEDGAWREAGTPHEVGNTALGLLALMAAGNTPSVGPHRRAVREGLRFLRAAQDPDTGLVGPPVGHAYHYDHSLAALALAQAYRLSRAPLLKRNAQLAVAYTERARNPYGAWRYDAPPVGDNDTSVSFWFALGLMEARAAGLEIEEAALRGALDWIDEVTDPATGRTGYDSVGSRSSRIMGINETFPPERYEAMTGAGLALRLLLAPDAPRAGILERQRELLERALPTADALDAVAYHHCTLAAYMVGGRTWRLWSPALEAALLATQLGAEDGDGAGPRRGSWDPVGPWGPMAGRAGTTALALLALQTAQRVPAGARAPGADAPVAPQVAAVAPAAPDAAVARGGLDDPSAAARAWLVGAQAEDGRWPAADDLPTTVVGATALAVLALASDDNETARAARLRGVRFLLAQQDAETGRFGEALGHSFHYSHALALLAVARATRGDDHLDALRRAVEYAERARNPYGAWRYDFPAVGDNDTSVTTWMVLALAAAQERGAVVAPETFRGALDWYEQVTDATSGRTGYMRPGGMSSRIVSVNDAFPTDATETLTAAALAARRALAAPPEGALLVRQLELLDRARPRATPGRGADALYWYFGTLALEPERGAIGARWRAGLAAELAAMQVASGAARGSWDPSGAWGHALGRVGTTALARLAFDAAR